jgi:YVTN family beta-propeller protein
MKKLILPILSIFLFFACDNDDENRLRGEYDRGVIITNEGNFGSGNSSVSFYDPASNTNQNTVFQAVNNRSGLGDILQSAGLHRGQLFLVVNNSNKVEVVDAFTMEIQYTLDDVAQPRYVAFHNDEAYLTEWVAFGEDGRVSVFDVITGDIKRRIRVGSTPEDIEYVNGKLYVTEAFSNILHIIDLENNNEITEVTIGDGASEMIVDRDQNLWIACEGGSDEFFNPLNNGSFYKVNTSSNEVVENFSVNINFDGELATNSNGSEIFALVDKEVYSFSHTAESLGQALFEIEDSTSPYSIGFDSRRNEIYIGDSEAFISDGTVYRYSLDGERLESFQVGVAPNGFLFN